MKRTRPKGDPDPGWTEISWEEGLDTVASRLLEIRRQYGAEAVRRPMPRERGPLKIRLAKGEGSPHIAQSCVIIN
jgi:anaerobic selenocysteine-containing dehydrogenase